MWLSKRLSLTRSRQLGALCWALILAGNLCVCFFPVQSLPRPVRIAIAVVLGAIGVAVVFTSLGLFTEKGDERSAENDRRSDAVLFMLIFLAMGGVLLLTKEEWSIRVGRRELLMVYASICLAKDLLFLAYERWAS